MKFRVKYEIELDGKKHSGVETEASWFLIDQQGNMYSHGPMEPIHPIEKEYKPANSVLHQKHWKAKQMDTLD